MKAATAENLGHDCNQAISIHAAREGGDLYSNQIASLQGIFQSTPPVKAATGYIEFIRRKGEISIHAAREGGDL